MFRLHGAKNIENGQMGMKKSTSDNAAKQITQVLDETGFTVHM